MLVNAISLKPFPQSTSNLKFVYTIYKTDAIDFGPSAKTKMAANVIFSLRCEHHTSGTISLTDSDFEILS